MNERPHKRMLHVVIDGLGSRPFEQALEDGHAPVMQALSEAGGVHADAISPYPSLTPVCLSTIITGSLPDVHRIPSLAWYHRDQRRFVEYGSSFGATNVEGTRQSVEDVVFNLNHVHLAERPRTMFELVEDAGMTAASVNYIVYRGRQRHTPKYPISRATRWYGSFEAVYAPTYFWYGELFGPRRPVRPQIGIKRPDDLSAARMASWLVEKTDTHYILLYLGEHDKHSHARGPWEVQDAITKADTAIGRVIESCGGMDQFLEEWGIIICADHGQTTVSEDGHFTWSDVYDDLDLHVSRRVHDGSEGRVSQTIRRRTTSTQHPTIAIAPSNRCAQIYRLDDAGPELDELAERANAEDASDVVSYRDGDSIVVLRGDRRLVATPDIDGYAPLPSGKPGVHLAERRWALDGDLDALDLGVDDEHVHYGAYPDALARLAAAHECVNSGDVFISAADGWEFTDIAGKAHTGGSHGSLHEVDSRAAFMAVGVDMSPLQGAPAIRLADLYSLVGAHLGLLPSGPFAGAGMTRGLE